MNNFENETNNNNRERRNRWIYPTCCEIFHKNQSQLHSALGGLILLIASSLHIGWSLWRVFYTEPWVNHFQNNNFMLISTSWYFMAIVGSFVAAVMVPRFQIINIYKLVFIMLSISGLAFITFSRYYPAILVGRSLAGLAHGIIYTTAITNAAENASPQFRCQLMSLFNYAIVIGIFITMLLFANTAIEDSAADQLIGIAIIVILFIGFIVTVLLNYLSIPYLLRNYYDDESIAINAMKHLRTDQSHVENIGDDFPSVSSELRNQFDELKLMIREEANESINIFESNNIKPLLLIIITRILSFLSSNIMINSQMIILGYRIFHEDVHFIATKLLFISMKLFAAFGVLFIINRIGHLKQLTIFGTIAATIMLIYSSLSFAIQIEQLANWLPAVTFMIYQIMVTFGIDSLQHCLLIDAFSSTKKAYLSIAFVTTFEYLLHILIIVIYAMMGFPEIDNAYAVIMGTSLTSLVMHLILEYYLPETNGLTLYRARQEFREQL